MSHKTLSTIPREIVLDDGKDDKYYSVISVRAFARASGVPLRTKRDGSFYPLETPVLRKR